MNFDENTNQENFDIESFDVDSFVASYEDEVPEEDEDEQ